MWTLDLYGANQNISKRRLVGLQKKVLPLEHS